MGNDASENSTGSSESTHITQHTAHLQTTDHSSALFFRMYNLQTTVVLFCLKKFLAAVAFLGMPL